jgi:hypothetical protein
MVSQAAAPTLSCDGRPNTAESMRGKSIILLDMSQFLQLPHAAQLLQAKLPKVPAAIVLVL